MEEDVSLALSKASDVMAGEHPHSSLYVHECEPYLLIITIVMECYIIMLTTAVYYHNCYVPVRALAYPRDLARKTKELPVKVCK